MEKVGKLVEEHLIEEDGILYLVKFYRKSEGDLWHIKLKIRLGDQKNGHLESPFFEYSAGSHLSGGIDEGQIK